MRLVWLTAWRGPAGTSQGSPTLERCWLASDWNYSRKPFPSSPALRCFGIHRIQALRKQWKESQLPARELGLQLHSMEVSSADKYESAFKEAAKARSGALASTSNALANSNQKRIADLATKNRLPAIYPREDWITNGGLMSYGPDRADVYKRVAVLSTRS